MPAEMPRIAVRRRWPIPALHGDRQLSALRTGAGFALILTVAACSAQNTPVAPATTPASGSSIKLNPCGTSGTLQLAVAQTTRVDCSNGGTTVTFAAGGASYLIVPEFATDQAANQLVSYTVSTGNVQAASISASRVPAARRAFLGALGTGVLPAMRLSQAQHAADIVMRQRALQHARAGTFRANLQRSAAITPSATVAAPPAAGSIRSFHVSSSFTTSSWATVSARLAFVGSNLLLYIDTLAPANGFTPAQLTSFGQYFDQTLYPIDTTAFGTPTDIDQNGRVIMLMSPVVNATSSASTCSTQGYVAGFFDATDFDGPSDPNSNQGEIFYTIVPDPSGTVSCAHTVAGLGADVPATFLHELQHLINYSRHVVVGGGQPGASWVDEGLSIVAEELGSVYYEQRCPPPACRTDPAQLFPDSSQGFVQGFLFDSYEYGLLPDTASITLGDDSQNGFSWRGGAWLLMRWLGDQFGSGVYKRLETGPSSGVSAIATATGQSFPSLFADFGLALYTDSLPGLARSTAPAPDRFTSRNLKQIWARLYATSGPSSTIPLLDPVQLFAVTTDTSAAVMFPGTTTYFRLDTPTSATPVTIRFSAPGGGAFQSGLRPQLAIFRLPPGQ